MVSRGVTVRMKLGDRHISSFGCQTFEQAMKWVEEEKANSVVTFEIEQWEEIRAVLHKERSDDPREDA